MSMDQDSAVELLTAAAAAAAAAEATGTGLREFVVGKMGGDPEAVRKKLEARKRMMEYAKG